MQLIGWFLSIFSNCNTQWVTSYSISTNHALNKGWILYLHSSGIPGEGDNGWWETPTLPLSTAGTVQASISRLIIYIPTSSHSPHHEYISKITFMSLSRRSTPGDEREGRYVSLCRDGNICLWNTDFSLSRILSVRLSALPQKTSTYR